MEHAFYYYEKAEKQSKTYQRKKEDYEFSLLINIKKKLAQGKGIIMFALPKTLIPSRWPRQFYI